MRQGSCPLGIIRMTTPKSVCATRLWKRNVAGIALALCASLVLGGCGETELNGKIFDMMGVSAAAQAAAKKEPKMAARSGLVLPPDQNRLPEPGSGDDSGATLASVDDPDTRRALAAAERARLHKAYCSGQLNWKERVADKDAQPKSPYGPCGMLSDAIKSQ